MPSKSAPRLMTIPQQQSAPIFVVGPPRSGTTLTARILGRHPDVFAPGETHYFEDIWTRYKNLESRDSLRQAASRTLTLFGRFNFPDTQKLVDSVVQLDSLLHKAQAMGGGHGGLYRAFMGILAESEGKTRFCDDTPKHLFYLPVILDLLPDAKAIVCVRDPRDFLCSYKNYWRRSTESVRIKALYHPIVTSLLWRGSSNLILKYIRQYSLGRVFLSRYETLVQHPEREVKRLCDFLGIDYSDALIQVQTHNSSFEQSSPGIFTTSVGRWRTCLSAEEVWWGQVITGGGMLALGYKAEVVKPTVRGLIYILVVTPWALIRALHANARKRGPLLKYLLRRSASLWQ